MRFKSKIVTVATGDNGEVYVVSLKCRDDAIVHIQIEERTPQGGKTALRLHLTALQAWDMCRFIWNRLSRCYMEDTPELLIPLFDRD